MPSLEKGQHAPLNVTQEAQHRIFVGLGWDPFEDRGRLSRFLRFLGFRAPHHDLDLSCFIYDSDGTLIGEISSESGKAADFSGRIYHSGDNVEGIGEGDDEQISVEFKNLPTKIHQLLFTASIKGDHTFDEVRSPEIRLVDGYSGHEFLKVSLGKEDGAAFPAFTFVHLYRDGEGWIVRYVGEYGENASAEILAVL
jgi:stress response protein SCP2